ncbi:MAG: acetate--CoA ligase family protein [Pseudomonadota bacterium]
MLPDIGKLLWPNAVAVIGASPNEQSLRGMIMSVLINQPFSGNIYPVNASHQEVQGRKAYATINEVPEQVDLAVLIIPAEFIVDEMERCGRAGVKAAAIITSGFAEQADDATVEMQRRLSEIIEQYDMAVLGPNAQGYANFAAALCPTFSPAMRNPKLSLIPEWHKDGGRVAAIAQSGALGFSFYDRGRMRELPFRYVVTTGNEAGLHAFDLVDYMLDEGQTDVFILFLEDIRDTQVFRRVAEKALSQGKPIIAAKVGASEAGQLSAASHTGALAGSHRINQAMFDHYGIITARDQDEMVDLASAFLVNRKRLPKGNRVGISSGTGGGAGWLSDACHANGLDVPELDPTTRARIDEVLPPYGSSRNPVDGTAQAIREVGYARLVSMVGESERIDALAMITSAVAEEAYYREKENFFKVGQSSEKPIVAWTYTWPKQETAALFAAAGYPLMSNLSNAALALSAMLKYGERKAEFCQPLECQEESRFHEAASLTEFEAKQRLAAHGIGQNRGQLVTSREGAVEAAASFEEDAVLKIQSADILHKTEAGGIALNVSTADEISAAYDRIIESAQSHHPNADIAGVLVEPMMPSGQEMIVGMIRDAAFGPMMMVGMGGIYAEILDDVIFFPPIGDLQAAKQQIRKLNGASILAGARGRPPADIDALAGTIVALSRFVAEEGASISEIDLNPVLVHEQGKGVSIVDALITNLKPQ